MRLDHLLSKRKAKNFVFSYEFSSKTRATELAWCTSKMVFLVQKPRFFSFPFPSRTDAPGVKPDEADFFEMTKEGKGHETVKQWICLWFSGGRSGRASGSPRA